MAKRTETQLVITAKDLGSAKLKELAASFRALRNEQRETANVADRTKVKQAELRATLDQLNRVLAELTGRQAKLDLFAKLGASIADAQNKLASAKQRLSEFGASTEVAAQKTAKFKAEQKALQAEVTRGESQLNKLSKSYAGVKAQIEALGLNSAQAQQQLQRLTSVTVRAASQADAALQRLPREQRLYRDELEKTAAAERERGARQKEIQAEALRRIAAENAALEKQNVIIRAQQAELARLAQRRNDVAVAFARQRLNEERNRPSGFAAFSQRIDSGALRNEQAAQRVLEINRRAEAVEARLNQERRRSVTSLGQLAGALRNTGAAQDRYTRSTKNAAEAQRTALSFSQRLRGQILSLGAAYFGVFGAISQAQRAINVSNQRIALNARLLVANGDSTEAAADELKFLRAEADRLGFSLTELGTNYSKLAIAGRSAGLETSQVREIFSNFAEVARVNNAGVEETERVFKALEQILSKGKVQAEELRGQLGDVLPGAYSAFARSLNVTGQELDELLKKGQVSSNALLGFSREYAKSVQGQLVPASKTLRAELGRLNTAYEDFLVQISDESLAPALREVADALIRFFKSAEGKEFGKELAQVIRIIGDAAIWSARNLDTLIFAAKAWLVIFAVGKIIAVGSAFLQAARAIRDTTTATKGLYAAIRAGEATGGLARLITLLGNPVFVVAAAAFGALAYEIYQYQQALNRAKQPTEAMRKAIEDLEAARGTDEEGKARRRVEALGREAQARLATAKATLAQAKANLELVRSSYGPIGEPGERSARAATELTFSRRIKEAEADIAQAQKDIALSNREISRNVKPRAADSPVPDPPALLSGEDEDGAAKKAAEELKRLKEKAAEEIAQINKDRLEQEAEDEAKALEAKLELNRIEYAERRKENEKLIADLRAAKQTQLADDLAAAQRNLDAQEQIAAQIIKNDAARERLTKDIERREKAINALVEERDRKLADIERRQSIGAITDLDAQNQTYAAELEYQAKVLAAVQALKDFIAEAKANGTLSLLDAMDVEALLQRLDEVPQKVQAIDPAAAKLKGLQEEIAGGLTNTFAALATGIANAVSGVGSFKDALKGAWDTFRSFIADFLVGLGKAILQVIILQQIQKAFGADSILGQAAGMLIGGNHSGGLVGHGARMHSVSPAVFAAAQRYHSGGVVGLGADEVPIIAKRGEEVLTENDPRHRGNGGMGGQQIKIVNAIDSASVVQEGLRGDAGTRAILNVVRANKAAFKAAIA